jgi:antitoxin (DNA-binding transcriptional repressor) of toxin-antitoxin stability system
MIYNITQAQKQFEKLVDLALAGEEVILARHTTPIARLVAIGTTKVALRPLRAKRGKRKSGKPRD